MELTDFVLSLATPLYQEAVRFYNNSKAVSHVLDVGQKRGFCRKLIEFLSNHENLKAFLRNNFTSESERYFESLLLSNPLNTLVRVEGEENLNKIALFRKCCFIFKIKNEYFGVPDEIFKICFDYFNKNKSAGVSTEVREYLTTLPSSEFSYKMSRAYLDPHLYFLKYLNMSIARDLTGSEKTAALLEESLKEVKGRFPMIDTLRKFMDFEPFICEIKRQKKVANLFHKADAMAEDGWLETQIEKFVRDFVFAGKQAALESMMKKLKADSYFNLKSLPYPTTEVDGPIKSLLCLGLAEVIYTDAQPVYLKLTPFGEKVYNIMFPTLEAVASEIAAAKKKPVRRTAILTPDFTFMSDSLDISQYIKLLCFSDLASADRVYQFTVARDSIMRSITFGMEFSDFKGFMQKTVRGELPENVIATVREWYNSVVVITEKKCVLLTLSASSERIVEIEKDQIFNENIIMKLKSGQYLAEPEKTAVITEYFKSRSIPVMIV